MTTAAGSSTTTSFQEALKLSPYFEHLDSTAQIKEYKSGQSSAGYNYSILDVPIEKSPNDPREYRCVLALLSRSPDTTKLRQS